VAAAQVVLVAHQAVLLVLVLVLVQPLVQPLGALRQRLSQSLQLW
jgi:hypothetical protein